MVTGLLKTAVLVLSVCCGVWLARYSPVFGMRRGSVYLLYGFGLLADVLGRVSRWWRKA